jgi:hypothetical protein
MDSHRLGGTKLTESRGELNFSGIPQSSSFRFLGCGQRGWLGQFRFNKPGSTDRVEYGAPRGQSPEWLEEHDGQESVADACLGLTAVEITQ